MIISASRRTDIPAFYTSWFMERIREGFVIVKNPFNPTQRKRVSLLPQDVDVIVFWTRNAAPLFPYLDELDQAGYRYVFLYTITGYGPPLETHCPALERVLETFQDLSRRIGSRRIIWRFDPIVYLDGQGEELLISRFDQIARSLSGYTERVIISFLDFYRKVTRRLQMLADTTGLKVIDVSENPLITRRIGCALAGLAEKNHMSITSCAEKADLSGSGILAGSCIDAPWLNDVFGLSLSPAKDETQRSRCRCAPSQDIGRYNTCGHGCVYCYAIR